jgi:hypothetical protein
MVASKFIYLSLLSVFRISAVSAVLTLEQSAIIHQFQYMLQDGFRFGDLCDATNPDAMREFISDEILKLKDGVNIYLGQMNPTVNYEYFPAPTPVPTVNAVLNGLPKLIYLVRYTNLRILNTIKQSFEPPGPQSIGPGTVLGVINETYVTEVSNQYEINKFTPPGRSFTNNMLEILSLYSMNRKMLAAISSDSLPFGMLNRYQGMIRELQGAMAGYMAVQNRCLYADQIQVWENQIFQFQGRRIRGRNNATISNCVSKLSNATILVIAIYAVPPTLSGCEIISNLLDGYTAVRRFMNLDAYPHGVFEQIINSLLFVFLEQLDIVASTYPVGYGWISKIGPMMMELFRVRNLNL